MYPLVYRLFGVAFALWHRGEWTCWLLLPYHPAPLEVQATIQRWLALQEEKSLHHNLQEWAAQVHFLYCCTWSILLAIGASVVLGGTAAGTGQQTGTWGTITSIAWPVIGLAALIHHYRYLCLERELAAKEEHNQE